MGFDGLLGRLFFVGPVRNLAATWKFHALPTLFVKVSTRGHTIREIGHDKDDLRRSSWSCTSAFGFCLSRISCQRVLISFSFALPRFLHLLA